MEAQRGSGSSQNMLMLLKTTSTNHENKVGLVYIYASLTTEDGEQPEICQYLVKKRVWMLPRLEREEQIPYLTYGDHALLKCRGIKIKLKPTS